VGAVDADVDAKVVHGADEEHAANGGHADAVVAEPHVVVLVAAAVGALAAPCTVHPVWRKDAFPGSSHGALGVAAWNGVAQGVEPGDVA